MCFLRVEEGAAFQVAATGHMSFGYRNLNFCSLEKCKKMETVMQDS